MCVFAITSAGACVCVCECVLFVSVCVPACVCRDIYACLFLGTSVLTYVMGVSQCMFVHAAVFLHVSCMDYSTHCAHNSIRSKTLCAYCVFNLAMTATIYR